jgi:hypothetical protein
MKVVQLMSCSPGSNGWLDILAWMKMILSHSQPQRTNRFQCSRLQGRIECLSSTWIVAASCCSLGILLSLALQNLRIPLRFESAVPRPCFVGNGSFYYADSRLHLVAKGLPLPPEARCCSRLSHTHYHMTVKPYHPVQMLQSRAVEVVGIFFGLFVDDFGTISMKISVTRVI